MCRLIDINSIKFLYCCNTEIWIVDYLPLNEIAHKVDSGWEDDVNGLVEMVDEMKVDESISMEVEIEFDFWMVMVMVMEMEEEG